MGRKKQYEIIDAGDRVIYRDKKVEYIYDKATGAVIGGRVFFDMRPRTKEEIARLNAKLNFKQMKGCMLDEYPPEVYLVTELCRQKN